MMADNDKLEGGSSTIAEKGAELIKRKAERIVQEAK